ncbi:barstar family protein [Chitinophaga deserti]|uniref:barstar family protein n=1 Tax=Chitinophaga deserti TaxID=2164099 RepID=UPI000D6CB36E|nr:barstar family protein [Chitinophaga deserti]
MEKLVTIDGSRITDIPSFYAEINRVFMSGEDWQLGNSLDAFNDLLYGGFGLLQINEPVVLFWQHMEQSRAALGYAVTKRFYEDKLLTDSPYDKDLARDKLAALESGTGQTYFDILLEIIAEHPNITLRAVD